MAQIYNSPRRNSFGGGNEKIVEMDNGDRYVIRNSSRRNSFGGGHELIIEKSYTANSTPTISLSRVSPQTKAEKIQGGITGILLILATILFFIGIFFFGSVGITPWIIAAVLTVAAFIINWPPFALIFGIMAVIVFVFLSPIFIL